MPLWVTRTYKPTIIIRLDGTEHEYESQISASKAEGIPRSYVSKMCRGMEPHWRGIKARYKNPEEFIVLKPRKMCKHCGSWPEEPHRPDCPRGAIDAIP